MYRIDRIPNQIQRIEIWEMNDLHIGNLTELHDFHSLHAFTHPNNSENMHYMSLSMDSSAL